MNYALMMLESALQQLVQNLGEKYDGARDRATLQAYAETFWKEKLRPSLPGLVAELELGEELDEEALDSTQESFCSAIVESLRDRGPRGKHMPVTLGWTPIGPRPASGGTVPPKAVRVCDYILAYDETARAFIYAFSPDYHQFGRAFILDESGEFRPFCKTTFRLGDAQQYWLGTWDAHRGGVVGWSTDGEAVVGVVVKESGLTVLASEAYWEEQGEPDEDDPPHERVVLGGDVPSLESDDWSDLRGVFGYDRARSTWVVVAEAGIWELGPDNGWKKRGTLPSGIVPSGLQGDREHSLGGAGGVWDGKRERVVFWFVDSDEETLDFASWDSAKGELIKLAGDGLPEKLVSRFGVGSIVTEHPTHGIVVYAGPADGLFTLGDEGTWTAVPVAAEAPPKSRAANLAFGPDDTAVQGPGLYALGGDDDDSPEEQGVFFVRRGGAWKRLGSAAAKSPLAAIKSSGGWQVLAAAGGGVFATAWRSSLETIAWTDAGGFAPLVSAKDGEAIFEEATPKARTRAALFEGGDEKLHALSNRGAVFRLDGTTWSVAANGTDAFGERTGFLTAFDEGTGRIVTWGGGEKGKGDNDTIVFAGGQWRKTAAAPRPRDLRYRYDEHGFDVDMLMVYDRTLGRVLRVGYEEIAVLDGDAWRVLAPQELRDFVTPSRRVLAHDPTTGETLCVCPGNGNVVRIDLGGCDLVGSIAAPQAEKADDDDEEEKEPLKLPFRDLVFDPATRRILTFSDEDAYGCYALDLGPAFELAKTLSPRVTELPPPPPPTVRLYRPDKDRISAFYADARDGKIVVRTGVLGGDLASEEMAIAGDAEAELARLGTERSTAGWVTADALDPQALAAAVGRPAWAIGFDDGEEDDDDEDDDDEDEDDDAASAERAKRAAKARNRVGGLPSGISVKDWPRDSDGEPLGFLLQVDLPEELGGGGLSVFVKVDGTATEDAENNVALLRRKQLAEAPPAKGPPGVPVLAARELKIGKRCFDIDADVREKLGAEDALLASALELAQPSKVSFDHLGGQTQWVQSAESGAPLLLQLDFDSVRLDGEWKNAGLHGAIYVVKTKKGATAFWQYT